MIDKIRCKIQDPVWLRKFHGWSSVFWLIAIVPICLFLANSVPFLVFISVYAIVTGEFASWQASRIEVKEEVRDPNSDLEECDT